MNELSKDRARGKLIVLEGLDGAGKSTQLALLISRLKSQGRRIHSTAEPTNSAIGGLIRDALGGSHNRSSEELAALFLADRIAHNINSQNGFQKYLSDGMDVICDRYYYSSMAYQGMDTGMQWVMDMNISCGSIQKPDLCIFLDADPDRCFKQVKSSRSFLERFEESADSLRKIRESFYKVFEALGGNENIQIVDGSGSIEEVAEEIYKRVFAILN